MATGVSKLLEEMTERLLVCEICQEDFQSPQRLPRVLPCHHAFCELCLQQLTKSKSFCCPLCRRSINVEGKFPVETTRMTILDLTKVMGNQEGPECQGCSKGTKASCKCLQCEDLLCEDCCQAHKTVKISRDHTLVSLAEAASNPSTLLPLTEKCSEHTEKSLEFFCSGCQVAACSSCFVLQHSGHKMVALEAVLEEKRKELKAVCGRLETAMPKFQNSVDSSGANLKALDTQHSKTSDKVRALFCKARKFLDDREGEILADLAAKVKEDRLGLEEQQAKDESLLSEAQASLQFGQRLASLGLPSQLLSGPQELTRTCDDLESRSADPAVPVPVYQVEGGNLDGLADVVKVYTKAQGMQMKDGEGQQANLPVEQEQMWKGTSTGTQGYVQMDVGSLFPNVKKVCSSTKESALEDANKIMTRLANCSVSNRAGRLFLHFPAEKRDVAIAVCQHFDNMVGAAESGIPSLPSSTVHQNEYDEILVNAAGKFFPEMFRKVRVSKNEHGKLVLTPALSREEHDLISGLELSEVQVKGDETEKAKTIFSSFLKNPDIHVEYLPSKKVVATVVRKYDLMQEAIARVKIHLGQMRTAVRGKRAFTPQAGRSDLDARGASAAAAEGTAEEARAVDNKITLPGGLVVIPYRGDITKLKVDAVVNDANERLVHDEGVARTIADAAGPDLIQECQDRIDLNGPIPVSQICITGPGRLPCNRVIHAVGPRWDARKPAACRKQLFNTVQSCCREAETWELREIAMPPISSGIFGMPKDQCTEMYCRALLDFDQQPNKKLKTIHFVDINDDMPLALLKALRKEIGQGQQRTRDLA